MEFSIIIHGDFKKRFKDKGIEIPIGVKHIWEKGIGIPAWDEYCILCDIFDNADNIKFVSEYTAPLSDAIVDDDQRERCYKTKKGYDFCASYMQTIDCTDCTCQSYSDDFIGELIQAVNEYYNLEFSYYEISIYGYRRNPCMVIHLYENEEAKGLEDNRILLADSEAKYFISDKNKIYAVASSNHDLVECKFKSEKVTYWSKVLFEPVDLEKCREVSTDIAIETINKQFE